MKDLLNLKCCVTKQSIYLGQELIVLDEFDVEISTGYFVWDENERFIFFKEIEIPKYRGLTNAEISKQFNLKYKIC